MPEINPYIDAEEKAELRRMNSTLQRQLRRAKLKVDDLVDATYRGAKDAFLLEGPLPPVLKPAHDRRKKDSIVALWDLGDWQGAKLTTTYNSDVMRQRVLNYCDIAEKITEIHRSDHPVRDCTIIFGGDMVEGLFNFPTQPFEIDSTLFSQYTTVSRLLIEVVQRALTIYEHVTVVAEWGNHGRIGSKRDAVPRSDNVDRMCYEFARSMLLPTEKRLTWPDCPEDIQRLEIGNYRAIIVHGDEIGRGGFSSLTTRIAWVTRQQSGAYPWQFRDCYMHHYHHHGEHALPNGLGSLYETGSTESDNRYAGVTMAASAIPSQRLNFIDPERGRVIECRKIWLGEDE